jgi:hypothetical protein
MTNTDRRTFVTNAALAVGAVATPAAAVQGTAKAAITPVAAIFPVRLSRCSVSPGRAALRR